MIIADTSVWIDYFNGLDSRETDALDHALQDGVVAIGDIILLEVLQGFRHDNDYQQANRYLSVLELHPMLGREMVSRCASHYRALRKKGITIRKTNDVVIASFCIEHNLPLLFSDRDFVPFVEHLGLRSAISKFE